MTETIKRKRGPKTEAGVDELKPVSLMLDEPTRRLLKVAGAGSESRGARAAARFWYDAYQADQVHPLTAEGPALGPFKA